MTHTITDVGFEHDSNPRDEFRELKTKTGDGKDLVILTGNTWLGNQAQGNSEARWRYHQVQIDEIGPRWRTRPEIVVSVGLSKIKNNGESNNAGYYVKFRDFDLRNSRMCPQFSVGIRDTDGFVEGFTYNITAVGTLA